MKSHKCKWRGDTRQGAKRAAEKESRCSDRVASGHFSSSTHIRYQISSTGPFIPIHPTAGFWLNSLPLSFSSSKHTPIYNRLDCTFFLSYTSQAGSTKHPPYTTADRFLCLSSLFLFFFLSLALSLQDSLCAWLILSREEEEKAKDTRKRSPKDAGDTISRFAAFEPFSASRDTNFWRSRCASLSTLHPHPLFLPLYFHFTHISLSLSSLHLQSVESRKRVR